MSDLRAGRGMLGKVAVGACLLSVLLWPAKVTAQGAPLSLVQIEKLVEIHSPDDLVAQEVRSRGLAFTPTQKILTELQKRDAGQATLAAIRERIPVGTLEIDGPPSSQVVLDGTEQGVTDSQGRLVLSNIAAGPHVLSVQKTGYTMGEFDIVLSPKEYKRFPAKLEWSGGYLSVEANPAGATIDISRLGQYKNSVSDLQCPPGKYDLTVTRPGMKLDTRSVVVASGQHASVEIHLVPDPQYLENQLADAKLRLARGDAQSAIQISNSLLALEARNPDVESLLAEAYLRVHDLAHFQSAAESAIAQGGTSALNLVHEHWELSGESFHPARLTLTAKTIGYDPMGAPCKYHVFTAPISSVELTEVTNKSTAGFMIVRHLTPGTFLLHLEIAEPGKHGKRMTFYFATADSQIVRENNIGFLASPSNSSQVLDVFAKLIQNAERNSQTK